jgi:methionine aminotransferase
MNDTTLYDAISPMYQSKRDLLLSCLHHPLLEIAPTSGTYFQLIKFKGDSPLDDVQLAKDWVVNQGVALIPTSVFYNDAASNRVFRVCFAKENDDLISASEKLNNLH